MRTNDQRLTGRRPLPEPHKNFRIILLSTASSESRAQDAVRSFGLGESNVVWWRPAPVSVFPVATEAANSRWQATVKLCRDEIVHELASNAISYDRQELAEPGVEIISENCAR